MDIFACLKMIGGLSLFLYGMHTMGDGLSKMAGGKLEKILEKLTANKFLAVLLGAFVTAVIQSSSATTVMVVGFVNSGLMKLTQAAGVIMGANVGTTITSWILSLTGIEGDNLLIKMLKPSSFAPIFAAIGVMLVMSAKDDSKKKDVGEIMLGFSVLMMGMDNMSSAVSGLASNPSFTSMMTAFSNPLLGIAVGAILTAIIQSSSASVGILQALCTSGAVSYIIAIPIIFGQNIGTCVTSIISSIGANKNARRASLIQLYFNIIGTVLFASLFYIALAVFDMSFLHESANGAGIALVHSMFNIGSTLVLFPFSNMLVKLATLSIPDSAEEEAGDELLEAVSIDERFLEKPSFAIEICKGKAIEMAALTKESMLTALETLEEYDEEKIRKVKKMEDLVDKYDDALSTYLVKLSSKNISKNDSQVLSLILHSISDFERISDHALNVVEASEELHEKNMIFSDDALEEVSILCRSIKDILELTVDSFIDENIEKTAHVEPLEEVVDILTREIKKQHVNRLRNGKCTIEVGVVLEDVLIGLERIADHCSNIAVDMLALYENGYNTHEYFKTLSNKDKAKFDREVKKLLEGYIKNSSLDIE